MGQGKNQTMKYLFVLLLSFNIYASEYEIDTNYTKLEHSWRGISVADYTASLKGIGFTWWDNSNFGVRLSHSFDAKMYTKGRYQSFVIDLKGITSLELLYRYEILNNLYLIGGISTNKMPVPITSIEEDYYRNDSDDDEGYIVGVQYKLNKHYSIGYRFSQTSRIKKDLSDEWTRGHSINFTVTF